MRHLFMLAFQKEHGILKDTLRDLETALIWENIGISKALLFRLNQYAGPHFRYEEEALWPLLADIYGEGYLQKLYTDHDLAIARMIRLRSMVETFPGRHVNFTRALEYVRNILPMVGDCEVHSLFLEQFDFEILEDLAVARNAAWENRSGLMEWAETGRKRKLLSFMHT